MRHSSTSACSTSEALGPTSMDWKVARAGCRWGAKPSKKVRYLEEPCRGGRGQQGLAVSNVVIIIKTN
jgi:hypothetical protein